MLILIIAVYACMELKGFFPKGSEPREALKHWHFIFGLSVLALMGLRLPLYLLGPRPRIEPELPSWQNKLAKVVHVGLLLLMICMPIAGWLILSAAGVAIPFWGLELPALIAKNKELASTIKALHEAGATIGYGLIGLHALAAIYHHYVVKDNTMLRMLPDKN